jgi:predicted ABC-type ATPase
LSTKRVRIFAGPNGSGKSTIEGLVSSKYNIGTLINADSIEQTLRKKGYLSFKTYGITVSSKDLKKFIGASGFNEKADLKSLPNNLIVSKNILRLKSIDIPYAYLGAILSEFIRNECLKGNRTFSFETVMSHPGKLEFIAEAKAKGFKTYLYFVCTESVQINIDRVQSRVELGGHPVPVEKTKSRYKKSLNLLVDAIKMVDRAFIYDNSEQYNTILIAEKNESRIEIFVKEVPKWFDIYRYQKT